MKLPQSHFRAWARFMLTYRRIFIVFIHLLLWSVACLGAFALRFDFNWPQMSSYLSLRWIAALLLLRTITSASFGAFRGLWRYTGAHDLEILVKATTVATIAFAALLGFVGFRNFPRSIFVIDWLGCIILVGGLRFVTRLLREFVAQVTTGSTARRLLIVGAGNAGEGLLRELQKSHASRYTPVGFVDDNLKKYGASIHGVAVLGSIADVPSIVHREQIDEVIIAIPTARGKVMRHILALCQTAGVMVRTIPSIEQLIDGQIALQSIRQVAIEDLLGRPAVALDSVAVSNFLHGQRILITGAGGSIGAELCRQICRFSPSRLILLERGENPLFYLERELLAMKEPPVWVSYIADICDHARLHSVLATERPTDILHTAAHKHVPMMESNACEAVKNNIVGTRNLADLADMLRVEHFVMISTDKAVNPTSIMGASKRAAEMYIQALAERSRTRFHTVRFGNVLGSQGSVIPIFKEQIARGGPVTVTHPEMRRYFMTIPEACQLVLQAAAMGQGGELFVLDMGEPVKIVDLARDLITLSGFVPDEEIEIRIVGMREGEKLFEELNMASEQVDRTLHPKIFTGRTSAPPFADLVRSLTELEGLAHEPCVNTQANDLIRAALHRLIPEYCGMNPAPSPSEMGQLLLLHRSGPCV